METMLRPGELSWAMVLSLIRVVGGFALFVAAVQLTAGEDPTVAVGRFLADSTEALLPLVGRLLVLWVVYLIVYTMVGGARDIWLLARVPSRLARIPERRGLFRGVRQFPNWLALLPASGSLALLWPWSSEFQSSVWTPGLFPQIE